MHSKKSKEGYISEVINAETCSPIVVFGHEKGCPDYYISDFTWNNYWKPYLLGSILIVMGLTFGCLGKSCFHTVIPFSLALYAGLAVLYAVTVYTNL